MPDNKPISIRTDEETAARFKEITADFPNAAEAFRALISAHEMAQAKGVIPGTETAINDFQAHLDFIMRGYLAALDTIASTEARVKQEYQERLESKDKVISSLQAKAEQYKAEAATAAKSLQEVTDRAEAENKEAAKIEADLISKTKAAEQARATAERAIATTEAANRALSETNAALKVKLTLSEAEAVKARELETKQKAYKGKDSPAKKQRNELFCQVQKGELRKPKICATCGATEKIELHHIIPVKAGGTNDYFNLVYMCHDCHMKLHHTIYDYLKISS